MHPTPTNLPQLITPKQLIIQQRLTRPKRQTTPTLMPACLIKINNPNIAISFEYISLREIAMNEASFMYFTELLEDAKSLKREVG